MGLEGVEVVLSGASTYEQLEENIGIFETAEPLNDEEMDVIKQVVEIINNNIAVDCTKCNYCLDYCPTDINIMQGQAILLHQTALNARLV